MPNLRRFFTPARLIGVGLIVILLVAMILNTKFVTPAELAAALPKKFDPKAAAADLWAKAQTDIPGRAKPLGEVLTAVDTDPKAAAQKYQAVSPAEGAYAFPVTTTGTVTDASADSLRLKVDGAPAETPILVPLGVAINGTAIRDVMGFKFADAPGQTDYQYVGDELKKLMQAQVKSSISDPTSLKGKKVTVVGVMVVLSTGAPPPKAKPVNIQPVTVKASA
jgi:predicted lipoprotein